LQRQLVLTRDNIVINIDTMVYYRIIDCKKSAYRVKNITSCVSEITYAVPELIYLLNLKSKTLRTVCGEHTLQEMLEKR